MSNEELDRVLEHNKTLLGELKQAKDTIATLKETEESTQGTIEALQAEIYDLKFTKPLESLIDYMFLVKPHLALGELEEDFKFSLSDDGVIQITDLEDQPIMIEDKETKKERPAQFVESDLYQAFADTGKVDRILIGSRASGGGMGGGNNIYRKPMKSVEETPKVHLGLR